jgi:hypothetical protein
MLLPTMTIEEIRREIEKDYPIVVRKCDYVSKKMDRYRKVKRDELLTGYFDYTSKYKNEWICKIEISKDLVRTKFMAYYYAESGLAAIGVLEAGEKIMYFTSHFLKRYNERRKLGIVMPKDLVKSCLDNQETYSFKRLDKMSADVWSFFCTTNTGAILGFCYDKLNFYRMNTFLTSSMLKGDQIKMEQSVRDGLRAHWSPSDWPFSPNDRMEPIN